MVFGRGRVGEGLFRWVEGVDACEWPLDALIILFSKKKLFFRGER